VVINCYLICLITAINLFPFSRNIPNSSSRLKVFGYPADKVSAISYGKERPADKGHDEAAWAKNRRDEFKIVN